MNFSHNKDTRLNCTSKTLSDKVPARVSILWCIDLRSKSMLKSIKNLSIFWSVLNQFISHINVWYQLSSVADPGFSIGGGVDLGGRGLSRRLHFENFICQNETSGPLGGVRRACPLDPPMIIYISWDTMKFWLTVDSLDTFLSLDTILWDQSIFFSKWRVPNCQLAKGVRDS